jgi:hypothetical protein
MQEKRDYKKEYENRKVTILNGDGEHIGVWGNLKSLCEDMKQEDSEFPSYWTLVRKEDNPIKFETKTGHKYSVSIDKIR